MQIVTDEPNCVTNVSHNHAEGGGKKEADLSSFGKLDTVRLKTKKKCIQRCTSVGKVVLH